MEAVAGDTAAGVDGAVVPVDAYTVVRDAYATWDADPCSVEAANGVVAAISAQVDAIRAGDPNVTNVVIVGADDQIPFARLADGTVESNERDYAAGTFAGENNVEADALAAGYYFSDDPFAAPGPLGVGSATLYLPTGAVGRLIQSSDEGAGAIENALTRFVTTGGKYRRHRRALDWLLLPDFGCAAGVRQPGPGRPFDERPDKRQLDHS